MRCRPNHRRVRMQPWYSRLGVGRDWEKLYESMSCSGSLNDMRRRIHSCQRRELGERFFPSSGHYASRRRCCLRGVRQRQRCVPSQCHHCITTHLLHEQSSGSKLHRQQRSQRLRCNSCGGIPSSLPLLNKKGFHVDDAEQIKMVGPSFQR